MESQMKKSEIQRNKIPSVVHVVHLGPNFWVTVQFLGVFKIAANFETPIGTGVLSMKNLLPFLWKNGMYFCKKHYW